MLKTNSSLSLRPLNTDEFLPPISRWTTLGGLILIGAVGTTLTLAALFKFNVTVKAFAMVRPVGELRVVQAELEGTVESIEVKVNQEVRRGEVIAHLNRSRLETQKRQLEGSVQQSQVQLVQMDAQIRLLDAQVAAEGRSLAREVSVAQTELSRSQRDYQEQQTTTQANLVEAAAALKLATSEMKRYQRLAGTGAVSQLQLEEKQAAVHSTEAQVARARAALNPSAAPVAIAQERITQEQAQSRAALTSFNREQESLVQRRSEIQAQLIREQKELQQIENELQRSVIRATSDGIIFQLNLRNPEQVVRSGDTIAEIAPSNNALVIKAAVATQNVDKVEPGQFAQLRIEACPYPDYGTLKGTVTAVSPDAIAPNLPDRSTSPTTQVANPGRYFEVIIQPEARLLTNGTRQCQLQPGMEAEANIISREETLLKFILRKARLLAAL